jgi:hypothetical protein
MTEHAEGTRGIAEVIGDLLGGKLVDEVGAKSFVLTVAGVGGLEKEGGRVR